MDKIELIFGSQNRRITNFLSYNIDADLYTPADQFELEFPVPDFEIQEASKCVLKVNGIIEHTGIVDNITETVSKTGGVSYKLTGRDLMGIIFDDFISEFIDLEQQTLKQVADRLLAGVPHIDRSRIVYQGGIDQTTADQISEDPNDPPQDILHLEPGQTKGDFLQQFAARRGQLFFMLPDGTFVFGRPLAKGEPIFEFLITKDSAKNNGLSLSRNRNSSKRYSDIIVLSDGQSFDDSDPSGRADLEDPAAPLKKTLVALVSTDNKTVDQEARRLLEKQQRQALGVTLTAPGHSWQGRNYTINRFARVACDLLNPKLDANLLLTGRRLLMDKKGGIRTELRINTPGVAEK